MNANKFKETKGIILQTNYTRKGEIERIILKDNNLYFKSIKYIPPIFIVIPCDISYLKNRLFKYINTNSDPDDKVYKKKIKFIKNRLEDINTRDLLVDNACYIKNLLSSISKDYDLEISYLRLEIIRNSQNDAFADFPLCYTSIGALTKISFTDVTKRNQALEILWNNRLVCHDVYSINYSANTNLNTIIDCLEPLFVYVSKIAKPIRLDDLLNIDDSDDDDDDDDDEYMDFIANEETRNYSTTATTAASSSVLSSSSSSSTDLSKVTGKNKRKRLIKSNQDFNDMEKINKNVRKNKKMKKDKLISLNQNDYNDLFEVDIQVFDNNENDKSNIMNIINIGNINKDDLKNNNKRKRNNITQRDQMIINERLINRTRIKNVLIKKPWSSGGILNHPHISHGLTEYFRIINRQDLTKLYSSQIDELPTVIVQIQKEYCSISCCVYKITNNNIYKNKKQLMKLSIYYCWDSFYEDIFNSLKDNLENKTERISIQKYNNSTEAILAMVADCKLCFWKDNISTYCRLVLSEENEEYIYSKYLFNTLLQDTNEKALPIQLEIEKCVRKNNSFDLYGNSITISSEKIVDVLGGNSKNQDNQFVKAFYDLNNSYHLCTNNNLSAIDRLQGKDDIFKILLSRHNLYCNLIYQLKYNNIILKLCEMCKELGVGLLDIVGIDCWENNRNNLSSTINSINRNTLKINDNSTDSDFVNSKYYLLNNNKKTFAKFIENSIFINILKNYSTYFSSNNSASHFKTKNLYINPINTSDSTGYYVQNDNVKNYIYDIDIESSYPSLCKMFNISPENSAIIKREEFNKLKKIYSQGLLNKMINYITHENNTHVIVSIKGDFYEGIFGKFMNEMKNKRKLHRHKELKVFYKQITNVLYGSMMNINSDMYSPQCAYSIISICRSLIGKIVSTISQQIIFVKTDGALIVSNIEDEKIVEANLNNVIQVFVEDNNLSKSPADDSLNNLIIKVKKINDCYVCDNNNYITRFVEYGNVKTVFNTCLLNSKTVHVNKVFLNKLFEIILDSFSTSVLTLNSDISFKTIVRNFFEMLSTKLNYLFENVDILNMYTLNDVDYFFDEIGSAVNIKNTPLLEYVDFNYQLASWKTITKENEQSKQIIRIKTNIPTLVQSFCILDTKRCLHDTSFEWLKSFCSNYCKDYSWENFMKMLNRELYKINEKLNELKI